MDKNMVKQTLMTGNIVQCSRGEYLSVRRYLQEFAAESIDGGQTIYATIALNEVKRLDKKFKIEL